MRYVRYLIWGSIAVSLIVVALANRAAVTLYLLPGELAELLQLPEVYRQIELPLFVVIFLSIAVGVLLGFVWEWLREHKHRAEASRKTREVSKLEREVKKLKGEKHEGKDDVLALLEDGASSR